MHPEQIKPQLNCRLSNVRHLCNDTITHGQDVPTTCRMHKHYYITLFNGMHLYSQTTRLRLEDKLGLDDRLIGFRIFVKKVLNNEKLRWSKQMKQMQTIQVEPTALFYRIRPHLNTIAPSRTNDKVFFVFVKKNNKKKKTRVHYVTVEPS